MISSVSFASLATRSTCGIGDRLYGISEYCDMRCQVLAVVAPMFRFGPADK